MVQVFGVFMRNWDETEELGNQNCSVERDFQVLPLRLRCRGIGGRLGQVHVGEAAP